MSYDEQPDGDPHGECAAEIRRLETENAAIRELMTVYNLGGWTDAIAPMQRALKAEAERDEWAKKWHAMRLQYAELRYPGMTNPIKAIDAAGD